MAETDWADSWYWSDQTPPPFDGVRTWAEEVINDYPPDRSNHWLTWGSTDQEPGTHIGKFYGAGAGGTTPLMKGGCKLKINHWYGYTGIFLGNPTKIEGANTSSEERDGVNGFLFGFKDGTDSTSASPVNMDLQCWYIEEGALSASGVGLGLYSIPPIFRHLDYQTGGVFEFEAALMVDDSQWELGGYDDGSFDPNRITGTALLRPYVRWNTAGDDYQNYGTSSYPWTWNFGSPDISTLGPDASGDQGPIQVGHWIRRVGTAAWYQVTVQNTTQMTVKFDPTHYRAKPNSGTGVLQYWNFVPKTPVWSNWYPMASPHIAYQVDLIKRVIAGDYHVGLFTRTNGWASTNIYKVLWDDVHFNYGVTP